ncbi:PQQ-dependent sugar dehydrogenase [Cedecea colo]|uniref:Sorbosone dehydrogenase family protein n=1 Tax=Cedecea colo TaxID=2552946 RepID=A0ABX0VHL4_9ENTR|nr:sorbosone dehydrogenase family protein [Cedecea colo]NIY46244.1 sorbosone dehydrogenase family protein [Cedecea colo]
MNKFSFTLPVMLTLSLALTGCDEKAKLTPEQQTGPNPVMPKARDFLMPPMQVPSGVGWKAGAQPQVAAGLRIEKMADGFMHPRQVYVLPNDDVLVVESNSPGTEPLTTPKQLIAGIVKNQSGKGGKGGNRITLLRKGSHGWEKHLFLENLHSPFGVQLIGDNLYVANTDSIVRYRYEAGETHISDPGTELADLPDTINHHWTKALLASPDGTKLYVGVGSNSNITENGLDVEYRRANVLEVDTQTGASRIFASGIRNPTGLGWEPRTGKLWAIANERDEIGADLVPDYLTSVQEGGFYGWPWSYFGQHVDRRAQPPRPDMVAKAIKPDYALSSHVAPLGLLFYTGHTLPQKYQGGAFISEHGSWDRSPLNGYQVSFVAFKDGKPVGTPETVVSGFVSGDEKELYGAPVGLTQDKQGALIVADDVGNTVWRVSAK